MTIPHSEYIFLDSFATLNNANFNILSLNIRSIPTNLNYFADSVLTHPCIKCDVIGFSETRLDSDLSPIYQLPGYSQYTKCRNRHGGGVALFVSDRYISNLCDDFCYINSFLECVGASILECVGASIKISNKNILVLSIYRPPSGNVGDFLDKLSELLSLARNVNYNDIYVIGDFNLDLLKHANNVHICEFINLMYSFSLFPLVTKPTRVTNTTASLIDHIWTTQFETNTKNYIIHNDTTDHFPVLSQFRIQNTNTTATEFTYKRCYTSVACDNFANEVAKLDWSPVIQSVCPNASYNTFFNYFNFLYQKHFLVKQVPINRKYELKPYITTALKNSIREKHRLERLSKKWPITVRDTYKIYRNKLTTLLRIPKNNYHKENLKQTQGNPKAHWNSINHILGRNSSKSNKVIKLEPPCSNTADKFNEHFLRLCNSVANTTVEINSHKKYLHNPAPFSIYLAPIVSTETEKYLTDLKTSSAGFDDISPKLLKLTASCISIPLTHIINLCFKTGIFPDNLKHAKVIPLHKSGSKNDVNNYRPISLLPAFSKLFEKAISTRLINYLELNKLLVGSQHGYRSYHSTETAILQFINNVYQSLENKLYVAGIFLDLSKAFDSLDHHILMDKLEYIGIRGAAHQLFRSYISNRSQNVYCNSTNSSSKPITKGVPQGSILGPILF